MGIIVGALIAILVTIAIEYQRRPRLDIDLIPARDRNYTDNHPAKNVRFLDVMVVNKPLPFYARWMSRNAAMQCHGTISFHHMDGQNIFGRTMPIRWSKTPEPVAMQAEFDGHRFDLVDPARLRIETSVDIQPGEGCMANVIARFDDDKLAYGWSNESYFSDPKWRNSQWELPAERFIVRIQVRSSGEVCERLFRFINDVSINDCRLEPPIANDKVRD